MTGTTGLSDSPSPDCRLCDQAHAPTFRDALRSTEQARDLTPKVKAIVIGTGTAGLPMALRAARHGYQIGVGIERLRRVATARASDGTPGSPESSTASTHPRAGAGSRHLSASLCIGVGYPMTLDAPCNRGLLQLDSLANSGSSGTLAIRVVRSDTPYGRIKSSPWIMAPHE